MESECRDTPLDAMVFMPFFNLVGASPQPVDGSARICNAVNARRERTENEIILDAVTVASWKMRAQLHARFAVYVFFNVLPDFRTIPPSPFRVY
jgi:hypothetical protein